MPIPSTRRTFVSAMAAVGATACAGVARAVPGAPSRKPNILFLMADDLGYADLGCTGSRHIATPNLDMLARDGVLFTHGYANSSICSPTRTALATGMYQQRFAIGLEEPVGPPRPDQPKGLPVDQPTIASVLKAQGYSTALVGKWHLGDAPHHGPLQHGYDHFFGIQKGAADYFRHRVVLDHDEPGDGLYLNNDPIQRHGYLTRLFADETIRLIEDADAETPFMIGLHFNAPHWPWEGPHDEETAFGLKDIQHHNGGTLEKYAEMTESMDANIGRVLAALQERGLADNTIVVFTSDNGGERYSDTWPFVGVKGELLEGGIRVPIIVRWPGQISPGRETDQVMTSMDFLPTFLAAAGGQPEPFGFDGVNLLPQLTGGAPNRSRTLYWRFKASEQAAVRDGDLKYLKLGDQEHLFNVATDPRERAELKDVDPESFARLKQLYAAWNADKLPYPASSFTEDVHRSYADRY